MPIIRVEMWEGRSLGQKLEIVAALTREAARILRCEAESVYVILCEIPKEHWGAGGQLCSDKYPDRTP